jgi:hypothetical protein
MFDMGNHTGKLSNLRAFGTINPPPGQMHERGNVYITFENLEGKQFVFRNEEYNVEYPAFTSIVAAAMASRAEIYIEFDDDSSWAAKPIYLLQWASN